MALSPYLQKLKDSLSCCTYNGAQHTEVLIEESDANAKLKKARIRAGNGDWFAFCPDKGRGEKALMSPLLACGKEHDHHRACDCVIVLCRDQRLTVVYVDLKSRNTSGYAGQFKSTRQFVRYAIELLKEFHASPLEVVCEQYVILYGGEKPLPIRKTVTALKPERISKTQPDKAYRKEISNNASLYLRELLGSLASV